MAPTTVPMKNGVTSEENANAAPAARCKPSRDISLRNANPAPRSTTPATASHIGSAQVVITAANAAGKRGPEDDQRKDEPDVVGLPHRGDRLVDQRARLASAPVAAGQQVPQAAAEVGPAQHGVKRDAGQQDGPDRVGGHHGPAGPAAWSSGTGGP